MKRLILLFSVLLLLLGCTREKTSSFQIDGSVAIDSLNGMWVYLVPSFNEMDMVIDSAIIESNQFRMKGDVNFNSYLALLIVTDEHKNPIMPLVGANLVIEPGEIKISFNSSREPKISGTKQNELIQHCDNAVNEYNKTCEDIVQCNEEYDTKMTCWLEARSIRNLELLSVFEDNINSDNIQALFLEYYTYFSKDELERIEQKMDEGTRRDRNVQMVMKSKNIAIGEPYINFELPNPDGTL